MNIPTLTLLVFALPFADGFEAPDDLSLLSDEFDDPATLSSWQRNWEVENWTVDQLEGWNIAETEPGWMRLLPFSSGWFEDYRGAHVFKPVEGDFVVSTRVRARNRPLTGPPGATNGGAFNSEFSLAGVFVRAPKQGVDGHPDNWWQRGEENYVFLSTGAANEPGRYQFEVKTTRDSQSTLFITDVDSYCALPGCTIDDIEIRVARLGEHLIMMHRLPGQAWEIHRRFPRADFPPLLHVGMTAYTDWATMRTYSFEEHNDTLIQSVRGNPGQLADPDIDARFDYFRFARPDVPPALQGADLSNPAVVSDAELLAVLGFDD